MSALLEDLGQLHIVTGLVTVTTNVWTLTSNDGSLTLTDNGAGDITLNFVEAFLSAPTVVATAVKASPEATVTHYVIVQSVTTTAVTFQFHHIQDTASTTGVSAADPDNGNGWYFIAIGKRNN
jgi:hypothetical protein